MQSKKYKEMRITKENTVGLIVDIQERLFPVMWEKEKLQLRKFVYMQLKKLI